MLSLSGALVGESVEFGALNRGAQTTESEEKWLETPRPMQESTTADTRDSLHEFPNESALQTASQEDIQSSTASHKGFINLIAHFGLLVPTVVVEPSPHHGKP